MVCEYVLLRERYVDVTGWKTMEQGASSIYYSLMKDRMINQLDLV